MSLITRVLRLLSFVSILIALLTPAQAQETTAPAEAPVEEAVTTNEDVLVEGLTVRPDVLTEVQAGAFIMRIRNVSPRDGSFDVDMWMWFRWSGSNIRPDQTFEIANGIITFRSDSQVEEDDGMNYATMRVQATVFHDFDVRRFPMDNHVIEIQIEDSNWDETVLVYTADSEATALDPQVNVPGWSVTLDPPIAAPHVYNTTYGLRSGDSEAATYSRLSFPISLERTSYSSLFKSFWVSFLAVVLGLLAFLVKSDDLDARFGMGVGSIFAASANAFILSDTLPQTNFITLAEQINLIAVGTIFLTVFVSIWSLRLRYADRDEASVKLDMWALLVFGVVFVILNLLVLNFDLSGAPPLPSES